MKGADKAWLTIGAFVVLHNVTQAGRRKELLSEAIDRHLETHPLLTRSIIAMVALHLCNGLPSRYDPLRLLFEAGEKLPLILGKPNRRL